MFYIGGVLSTKLLRMLVLKRRLLVSLVDLTSSFRSLRLTTTGNDTKTPIARSTLLSLDNQQRCKTTLKGMSSARLKPYWRGGRELKDMPQAAVLVPLCIVNGDPSVLLTLRTKKMSGYSGQVSFPGGKADGSDADITDTALRESTEEIGLDRAAVTILGKLPAIPGRNFDMAVTPVVGVCGDVDLRKLYVNHDEVAELFACSLVSLCSAQNARYTTFRGTKLHRMPAFTGQSHRIWGLSAIILHQTLMLLAPNLYTGYNNLRF